MKTYDPLLIRQVILNLNRGFSEIITADPNLRYYQNIDGLVQVRINEEHLEFQVEEICKIIKISRQEFDKLYRKTKERN